MQKRTTMMGTACVLAAAALTAGPAAAGPLTDFSGVLTADLSRTDSNISGSQAIKAYLLGGSVAMPLSTIDGLNAEVDGSFQHNWASHFSQEAWQFGGSAFWAGMDGRIGVNVNYSTSNESSSVTNGGLLAEWYFGPITVMGKGGWLSSTANSLGGHGNYLGGAASFYVIPDLAITAGARWNDLITGAGCQICGRNDLRDTTLEIIAEFLFSEDMGLSGFASYAYDSNKFAGSSENNNTIHIGVRWYTSGGGSLMDHHRNGNLNPWLPGS